MLDQVRERLADSRMALVVPLSAGQNAEGFLAVGERVSGLPFTEEDREFAQTLGRQAVAALESVRLHRLGLEQQRRDREMQIAREIQQSLFPRACPAIPGFEVAALSDPCQEVGGDHYDFIPLEGGRLALAVADWFIRWLAARIRMFYRQFALAKSGQFFYKIPPRTATPPQRRVE